MTPSSFYDRDYYASHYGHLLGDEAYRRQLGLYWREALFVERGIDPDAAVLDFGCGLGQVSAGLPRATLHDLSSFAMDFLERTGRKVVRSADAIPHGTFDVVLSSHSLEHVPEPALLLSRFREFVRPEGRLVLVLPIEVRRSPSLAADNDRHLYCWTFQAITNLLAYCGWRSTHQSVVHSPFMLRTLGARLSDVTAVRWARRLGRWKRSFPSMLTIAAALP